MEHKANIRSGAGEVSPIAQFFSSTTPPRRAPRAVQEQNAATPTDWIARQPKRSHLCGPILKRKKTTNATPTGC
jgi:hypothetical protein